MVLLGSRGTADLVIGRETVVPLLLLALVPGLLALLLYYRGLRQTPASAATIAELAFPLSALLINWLAFGATLAPGQVLGLAALAAILVHMAVRGRTPDEPWVGGPVRAPSETDS